MIATLANHLWQSTLFALAIATLTMACRKNQARVRHALWMAASLKFLVPFALFIAIGSEISWPASRSLAAPAVSTSLVDVSEPFGSELASTVPAAAPPRDESRWTATAAACVWLLGTGAIALVRFREWRRLRVIVATSSPCRLAGV